MTPGGVRGLIKRVLQNLGAEYGAFVRKPRRGSAMPQFNWQPVGKPRFRRNSISPVARTYLPEPGRTFRMPGSAVGV